MSNSNFKIFSIQPCLIYGGKVLCGHCKLLHCGCQAFEYKIRLKRLAGDKQPKLFTKMVYPLSQVLYLQALQLERSSLFTYLPRLKEDHVVTLKFCLILPNFQHQALKAQYYIMGKSIFRTFKLLHSGCVACQGKTYLFIESDTCGLYFKNIRCVIDDSRNVIDNCK